MTTPPNLRDLLHDATVGVISIEWPTATVTIHLRLSNDATSSAKLVASAFSILEAPRKQPWGPSCSVNEASIARTTTGEQRLELQLQSGDTMLIEARSIEFIE